MNGSLVLFDGECALCNASVRFVAANDPLARFTFAPLQSPAAQKALAPFGSDAKGVDGVVLVDATGVHVRSDAALRITCGLRYPWRLAGALRAIPRPVRDAVYAVVARNRYRWFGKADACALPSPELARRLR